jgi:spermidine synthase
MPRCGHYIWRGMRSRSKYERKKEKAPDKGGLVIVSLVFASGFAGLVYQVLWMKQIGLLFGSTSQAAAVTLAAFFAGLGAGSWWWGRRVAAIARPLRFYAWMEFGIALSALTYFGVLKLFHVIYPSLYGSVSGTGWMLAVKFVLALLLVFPAAFFMGGTVPVSPFIPAPRSL